MKRFLFSTLFCISFFFINAQEIQFDVLQKVFHGRNYFDLHSDKDGNMWIIRQQNILKYSGDRREYQISSKNVDYYGFSRMKETQKGKKYVIDWHNQIFFVEADTFRAYPYNDTIKKLSKGRHVIDFYFDQKEQLHISLQNGVYFVIDSGTVSHPLIEKGITFYGHACIFLDDKLPFLLEKVFPRDQVEKEDTYYYLFNRELELIDKKENPSYLYGYPPSIVQLSNGNYLYSSGKKNILHFSKERIIEEFEFSEGIISLFIDSKLNLWVSTQEGGIKTYKNEDLNSLPIITKGFTSPNVAAEDFQGGIWFTSVIGVHLIKNTFEQYLEQGQGYALPQVIYRINTAKDELFIVGEESRISILNTSENKVDSFRIQSELKKATSVFDAFRNPVDGRLWATMRGQIGIIRNKQFHRIIPHLDGKEVRMPGKVIRSRTKIYQQKAEVDFSLFYKNHFVFICDTSATYHSTIPEGDIIDMVIVGDSTFLASSSGLYLHTKDSIVSLGEKFDELKGTIVYLEYFNNKLWISSHKNGVYTLQDNELKSILPNPLNRVIDLIKLDEKEMLAICRDYYALITINKVNNSTIKFYNLTRVATQYKYEKNSQTLYGLSKGERIQKITLADIKRNPLKAPKLFIEELKLNKKKVPNSKIDSSYQLEYNEGFIDIKYKAIGFQGKKLIYRHRMLGLNDKWTSTASNIQQFTTLPPGKYTFEVQTQAESLLWSPSKRIHFEVMPPIWKTWWFILLMTILGSFILAQIVTRYINAKQKKQQLIIDRLMAEQKALRAQMDPHFVFNVITSLQYLIMSNSNKKAIRFLNMFTKSMRNILDQANSSNNSISIRSEINFLREYIEMERFRLEDRFDYEILSSEAESCLECTIPPFMIQPFVENAIQHGLKNKEEKGLLKLTFELEGIFLKITIVDDGVGRKAANQFKLDQNRPKRNSHGMSIIKERLKLHNSRKENVWVKDIIGQKKEVLGTSVTLLIKIQSI